MPVGTVEVLVEALALLRLVVSRNISALLQLVATMRKRALVIVLARALCLPELADLRLE